MKEEYEVGEMLDLNCISSKSSPPAKISWYINDSPVSVLSFIQMASHSTQLRFHSTTRPTVPFPNIYNLNVYRHTWTIVLIYV